jgi:hypothetical protein
MSINIKNNNIVRMLKGPYLEYLPNIKNELKKIISKKDVKI